MRAKIFHPMALANRGTGYTVTFTAESSRTISTRTTGLPQTTLIIHVFFTIWQTKKVHHIRNIFECSRARQLGVKLFKGYTIKLYKILRSVGGLVGVSIGGSTDVSVGGSIGALVSGFIAVILIQISHV